MDNSSNTTNSPAKRGRSRGRGNYFSNRRGRGNGPSSGNDKAPQEPAEPPPNTMVAPVPVAESTVVQTQDEDGEEKEVCFICASDIVHLAIAPCNHRTCHICSLRWRALYKTNTCAHCRTPGQWVIFTDDDRNYADFAPTDVQSMDSQNGIKFTSNDIAEESRMLLELNCPDETCDRKFKMPQDLKRHVNMFHKKRLCDLCFQHKRVFTHEHTLYTPDELKRHLDKGDDKPGATDQSGFKGHPKCGFCKIYFYSNDELLTHCRDDHERCYLCTQSTPQYFMNYDALEDHFRRDHFLCLDRECLEKKFVAFGSLMDLKAHQLEQHPNGITKESRRIDLSDFDVRERYVPEGRRGGDARGGRHGRGRSDQGRNADGPNTTSNVDPSSTRLTRAVENTDRNDFPTLPSSSTTTSTLTARPARAAAPRTTATPSTNTPVSTVPRTREEMVRQMRHGAVIERASRLFHGNESKITQFRNYISSYRSDALSAPEFIEKLNSLSDTNSAELGTLIKELADLFENSTKQKILLNAWNDWRAVNDGYPSLPGSSDPLAMAAAAGSQGGARVLKLKSSTAKSGRSNAVKNAAWGAVASGPTPGVASSWAKQPGPTFSGTTPWANSVRLTFAGAGGGPSTPGPSGTSSPASFAAKPKAPNASALADSSAFPALPSRPKKSGLAAASGVLRINMNSGSSSSNSYYRSNSNTSMAQNAWGSGSSTKANDNGSNSEVGTAEDEVAEDSQIAKGKRKKEKQVLMHFG